MSSADPSPSAAAAQDGIAAAASLPASLPSSWLSSLAGLAWRVPTMVWFGALLVAVWLHNLYVNQGAMLYHPAPPGLPFKRTSSNPPPYHSPGAAAWGGGLSYAVLSLRAADGVRLHGWFVRARAPPGLAPPAAAARFARGAPTLVFYHANAGNLGLRLPNVAVLALQARVNVLIFDYRGYGDSDDAVIDEPGLTADGVAALRAALARADADPARVFLFGRSLGGAVALAALAAAPAADRAAVAGVILENTFTSIADMVDHVLPAIAWLKPLILRIRWDSLAAVPAVAAPVLFISGDRDALVPQRMMRRLHDAAAAAPLREFYSVPGGEHNDSFQKGGAEYVLRLLAFMTRALQRRGLDLYNYEAMVAGAGAGGDDEHAADSVRTPPAAAGADADTAAAAAATDAAVPREAAAVDAAGRIAAPALPPPPPPPPAALGTAPALAQALLAPAR